MKLFVFLSVFAISVVGHSADGFDYNSINFDGPNCWAYVAMEKGFIKHYRYVSDDEILYYLDKNCEEIKDKSQVKSGDVFSIYDKNGSIRHSGLFSRVVGDEEKILEKGSGNKEDKVGEAVSMSSEQLKAYGQNKKYYRCKRKSPVASVPQFMGKSSIDYLEKEIALAIKMKKLSEANYKSFLDILNKYSQTLSNDKGNALYKYKVESLLVQLKKFDPNKSDKPVFRKPPPGFFDNKTKASK